MWALISIEKKNINKLLCTIGVFLSTSVCTIKAQTIQYQKEDSLTIVRLLNEGRTLSVHENKMMFFARQFLNVPYVAGTLDQNNHEVLVINTRELDCTTFTENVLALTLCAQRKLTDFISFCKVLKQIRYRDDIISYPTRLHYFIDWIKSNTKKGFVQEITYPHSAFTGRGIYKLGYMSSQAHKYPMLVKNPQWIKEIKKREEQLSNISYNYIPKESLNNTDILKNIIKDGDIIAILTSRTGLDTSHIGIASWHNQTLHLFNASRIRGKVVDEITTLYNYMQTQRLQKGILVIRVLS